MEILTILTTIHNEAKIIRPFLEKINTLPLNKEIIVVDDGSTDGSDKIIRELKADNIKIIHHTSMRGKSAAFLTGLSNSTGDYILTINADFNLSPHDFLPAVNAIKEGKADIIIGTKKNISSLNHKLLTFFINLFYSGKLNSCIVNWKLASKATWNDLKNKINKFDSDLIIITSALRNKKQILEIEERL